MTEANLRPSWASYQSHNTYCLHKSCPVCIQFQEGKKAIHFILLRLVQPTSVTGMLTIWWKSSCTLTSAAKDAWYCLYRLQSLTDYARNSRKKKYAFPLLSMNSKPRNPTSN